MNVKQEKEARKHKRNIGKCACTCTKAKKACTHVFGKHYTKNKKENIFFY